MTVKPPIGSLWQENDRRSTRVVEVVEIKKNTVRVKTVVSFIGNRPGTIRRVTKNDLDKFLRRFRRLN